MLRSRAGTGEDRKMQRSTTRIRTSHVGRLPPPKGWEDMPGRLASAEITDAAVIAAQGRYGLRPRRPGPRRPCLGQAAHACRRGPPCVDVSLALVEHARGCRRVPSPGGRVRLLWCLRYCVQLAVTLL